MEMEACLYDALADGDVRCRLCHHRCLIHPRKSGLCGVRQNRDGVLYSLVYGKVIARHIDPIEKKPLFHVLPGSRCYSLATVGCNFRCRFCQNADIAQMPNDYPGSVSGSATTPEREVAAAVAGGCRSIAYTYTEPTVFFEFALETARLAHEQGLVNIFVTNGYMTKDALAMIQPYLHAANVDLKAFSEAFYKKMCGARLAPVKETLKTMRALGVFVEVTTLIIPGLNDDPEELQALAAFLVNALGADTPWHVSRFHPTYQLNDRPITPHETLMAAHAIGRRAGLRHIYVGNVPGGQAENTFCHGCGRLLIQRTGFQIIENALVQGTCPHCRTSVVGMGL